MKPYYQDSAVKIYHGDCREILPSLPKVDLVLTDPPYGIGFASQPTTGGRARGQGVELWDEERPDIQPILEAGRQHCIWGGNYFSLPTSRGWLAWCKPDAPPSMGHFELAWTSRDDNTRKIECSIAQTNPERLGHPTQKPLAVILWCLSFFPDAQTILDPFMGSGTTLRAAKDLGRKAIGIEIEERYCEIAAKRMAQEVLAL
jgi:site-specific DNA-methyltransferase (adenine-specific)